MIDIFGDSDLNTVNISHDMSKCNLEEGRCPRQEKMKPDFASFLDKGEEENWLLSV